MKPQTEDALRAEIEQLRGLLLARESRFPAEWHLGSSEVRMMGALFQFPNGVGKLALIDMIWRDSFPVDPRNQVSVMICRLNRKLRPFGVSIERIGGGGPSNFASYRVRPAPGEIVARSMANAKG